MKTFVLAVASFALLSLGAAGVSADHTRGRGGPDVQAYRHQSSHSSHYYEEQRYRFDHPQYWTRGQDHCDFRGPSHHVHGPVHSHGVLPHYPHTPLRTDIGIGTRRFMLRLAF